MQLKEFVQEYEKNKTNNIREKYLKDTIQVKDYIDFMDKCNLSKRILDSTMFKFDDNGNKTSKIDINSVMKNVLFVMVIIDTYTNIDVNFEDIINEYNMLEKNSLIEKFICLDNPEKSIISTTEILRMKSIMDMQFDDIIRNKFSIDSYIEDKLERLNNILSVIINPLFDSIPKLIEDLNENKTVDIKEYFLKQNGN